MTKQYFTKTELSKRWSISLINKYYPQCDEKKVNPFYRRGSPIQLYDVSKVAHIETNDSFKVDFEKVNKHKIVAKEGAKRKREKLMMYANGVQINIPSYEKDKLIKKACDHYNSWNENAYYSATPSSDLLFLKRICINYLRHQCTCYDEELRKFYGKVGVKGAHNILQTRINEAIKEKYEWLRWASMNNIFGYVRLISHFY